MVDIIHGATGAQGSPVLSALTAAGRTAIAVVRHPEAVPDGIAAREVDLASADSLASAYEGADGVFVHLPMGAPEAAAAQARAVVEAVDRTRPGRVVISTSGRIVDQPDSPLQAAAGSPIMTLIDGVTGSGVPTAVVAPRLYLENLLLPVVLAPARQEGVLRYPLPASFPVSWSSHLDVADVVARRPPARSDGSGPGRGLLQPPGSRGPLRGHHAGGLRRAHHTALRAGRGAGRRAVPGPQRAGRLHHRRGRQRPGAPGAPTASR